MVFAQMAASTRLEMIELSMLAVCDVLDTNRTELLLLMKVLRLHGTVQFHACVAWARTGRTQLSSRRRTVVRATMPPRSACCC